MGVGDIIGGILVIIFGFLIGTWPPLAGFLLTYTSPVLVWLLAFVVIVIGFIIVIFGAADA